MAVQFVKNIGTAFSSSSIATQSITVPAGGVPAGHLVVVRQTSFNWTSGTPACSDSRSNTYAANWASNTGALGENNVFSSVLTTSLQSGDTISVSVATGNQNYCMCADEFAGSVSSSPLLQAGTSTTGTSTAPSCSATPSSPPANILIVGFLEAAAPNTDSFTEDSTSAGGDTWHSLTAVTSPASGTQMMLRGAYKIPTNSATAQTWAPTLGVSHTWVQNVLIYKGAPTVPVFPASQYLSFH